MKRFYSLALALIFALTLAPVVRADIIMSPIERVLYSVDIRTVLLMVCIVTLLSGIFLWFTRKKK